MIAIAVEDGRIAGVGARELAARFGTPLYVYDFDVITARVEALRAALPPSFELAYAAKANPNLAILDQMRRLGVGLDVASGGELLAAHRAGLDPASIVFTGPGKTDAELAAAVDANLRAVTVESAGELARLERIAAAAGRRVPILLRVAVRGEGEETPILAGGWRKFGIDARELDAVACRASDSSWFDLLGLHAFGASNVRAADAIAAHVARTVELAAGLASRIGFGLQLVDAGGGLGIPYRDDEEPLDLDRLAERLATLAAGWGHDPDLAELPVLLEPGRFLVGPAGLVVARVLDVKEVGDRTVAILDAGIHTTLRSALVGSGHRVRLLAMDDESRDVHRPVLVAGPLCTGLDVLPEGLLRVPCIGDLVAILDLGAYGFTESMPLFLSHPVPGEVAVWGGQPVGIRRSVAPAESLATQRIPARAG
ncbi:MAG: diaminopimelate decarboxylase family protein [Candidatus Limnocylindria bacterium]